MKVVSLIMVLVMTGCCSVTTIEALNGENADQAIETAQDNYKQNKADRF